MSQNLSNNKGFYANRQIQFDYMLRGLESSQRWNVDGWLWKSCRYTWSWGTYKPRRNTLGLAGYVKSLRMLITHGFSIEIAHFRILPDCQEMNAQFPFERVLYPQIRWSTTVVAFLDCVYELATLSLAEVSKSSHILFCVEVILQWPLFPSNFRCPNSKGDW